MNHVRPHLLAGLAALLVCSGGQTAPAQGIQGRGRAIQFSDPRVEVITSNLNQSASSPKSSLRNLDDQFKAPFNVLDSGDPVNGVGLTMPTLRTPTLSPRAAKKLQDKKQEEEQWIFGSPEELEAQRLSAERMFGVTEFDENGVEKSGTKTPLQRYWDRMERERLGQTNRVGSELSGEKTDQEIKDQAKSMFGTPNLPMAVVGENETAATGKSSLTPTYGNSFLQDAGSMKGPPELFSAPAAGFTSQQNEATKARINDYKQLFDTKGPSVGGDGGFGNSSATAFTRPSSVADYSSTPLATWRPTPVAPVSSFNSSPGASLATPIGGYSTYGVTPTPPPISQPPRMTTPPVGFQLPKRSF